MVQKKKKDFPGCGYCKQHALHERPRTIEKSLADEVIVVKGGRHAYVWVGKDGKVLAHFSGSALLRRVAKAILSEVGE